MLFIILTVLAIIGVIITFLADSNEGLCVFTFVVTIICAIVSIGMVAEGMLLYPKLYSEYEQIITYKNNIETMRNAYYEITNTDSALLHGSIENLKQSTNLSEYLDKYITNIASYNKKIKKAHIFMQTFNIRFISCYSFADDRILTLPLIE